MQPNQDQNIQPDFSFIAAQQPVEPPKKSKKMIVLIISVILLLLLSIALFLTSKIQHSVKPTDSQPKNNAEAYIQVVKKQDFPGAYSLLDQKVKSQLTQDKFAAITKEAFQGIDLSTCSPAESNSTNNSTKEYNFYCLHNDKKTYIRLKIVLGQNSAIYGVYVL